MQLENYLHTIPDFPKKGIQFKDICPLLADPKALKYAVAHLAEPLKSLKPDVIAGVEARGFLLGILLAQHLGVAFLPIRKAGKLPGEVLSQSYGLEYGEDVLELQKGSLKAGNRVVVHDDVLATGGTAAAAGRLVSSCEAELLCYSFLMELDFLEGREKLHKPIYTVLHF
ncbi:MAG: adenine phosphoribosyltransferase [Leeuwenhoekiella sp.]